MWVPVPPSAEAALAGATVLANLSGSPITVARAEDRRLLVRSASARCLAAYLYAAAGAGRVEHRPVLGRPDDGLRVRRAARRDRALPRRAARDGRRRRPRLRIRQERLRQGTFDDNRRSRTTATGRVPRPSSSSSARRPATSGCGARSTGSRSCPTTPSGSRWTATRPTTSRSPGSSSGCARSASPKVVIGVSGGLDSTHALIVAAKAMDRLGRPAQRHPRLHAARASPPAPPPRTTRPGSPRRSGVTFEEIDIRPAAGGCWPTSATRSPTASRSTT